MGHIMANLGQSHAVHALYNDHQGWLHGWLRSKLGNTWDAADLVHDTFVKVLLKDEWSFIREPRAYLTTIAHGLMVNSLRRKDLERAYLEAIAHLPEDEYPSPETRALVLETLLDIDAMLDGLAPNVRHAFLLLQLEGLRHAEIAERLGVSVSSVRQYIAKAIQHCVLRRHD